MEPWRCSSNRENCPARALLSRPTAWPRGADALGHDAQHSADAAAHVQAAHAGLQADIVQHLCSSPLPSPPPDSGGSPARPPSASSWRWHPDVRGGDHRAAIAAGGATGLAVLVMIFLGSSARARQPAAARPSRCLSGGRRRGSFLEMGRQPSFPDCRAGRHGFGNATRPVRFHYDGEAVGRVTNVTIRWNIAAGLYMRGFAALEEGGAARTAHGLHGAGGRRNCSSKVRCCGF